ncbi:unnamed protein product [Rangifer tarandus platyrhynchus]|uniref:Uncharacterized protein n=1 Tax=Rangifer tarandus platyrhynchus TaxID=3082113 RepID=A0AC59ZG67_RANTA
MSPYRSGGSEGSPEPGSPEEDGMLRAPRKEAGCRVWENVIGHQRLFAEPGLGVTSPEPGRDSCLWRCPWRCPAARPFALAALPWLETAEDWKCSRGPGVIQGGDLAQPSCRDKDAGQAEVGMGPRPTHTRRRLARTSDPLLPGSPQLRAGE